MQTIRTEISIWGRDVQRSEDPGHTLHTYTQMYGVFFLMFTRSEAVFIKDAGRFVTVLTCPFCFLPAACFFPRAFVFFPAAAELMFLGFLSHCVIHVYMQKFLA